MWKYRYTNKVLYITKPTDSKKIGWGYVYEIHTHTYIYIYIYGCFYGNLKKNITPKTHPIPTIVVSTNLQKLINFVLQKFISTKHAIWSGNLYTLKKLLLHLLLLCRETSFYLPYLGT